MKKLFSVLTIALLLTNTSFAQKNDDFKTFCEDLYTIYEACALIGYSQKTCSLMFTYQPKSKAETEIIKNCMIICSTIKENPSLFTPVVSEIRKQKDRLCK